MATRITLWRILRGAVSGLVVTGGWASGNENKGIRLLKKGLKAPCDVSAEYNRGTDHKVA